MLSEDPMLQKLPTIIGHAVSNVRAGAKKLFINDDSFAAVPAKLDVRSPVFDQGAAIPPLYTADGEKLSPPLTWVGVPPQTRSIALVVEDADSPTPDPLVHALAWNFEGRDAVLVEGELSKEGEAERWSVMGLNSFRRPQYTPPDPPPGHGRHRYAFQVFAVDRKLDLAPGAGRTELLHALRKHVLAKGLVVGTYERRSAA
jgi:Raf kinase inhibitor-like YbhB/YbcL family protein